MSNANEPAFPMYRNDMRGMTKREYFAAMAMQQLIAVSQEYNTANRGSKRHANNVAEESLMYADAVLVKLEKTKQP